MVLPRSRVAFWVALITIAGGALRFYGLGHGAPYHFHADEMLALRGTALLKEAPHVAAQSAKFFIYPVLPKELLATAATVYEAIDRPFDLATERDAETLMLLGRGVSALFSAATIPILFLTGRCVAGDLAGLLAAAFGAASVVAIANAHFFTADSVLTFFCALTLFACVRLAGTATVWSYVFAGAALGAALASKYTAAFLVLPFAAAHLASPARPPLAGPWRRWLRWAALGAMAGGIALLAFLALNPLVVQYPDRFVLDIREGIVEPNFQGDGPVWTAQFRTVSRYAYWFTNLLPWNLGPALALWALAGVAWLVGVWRPAALTVAAYTVFYYAIASQTTTPYMRYLLPALPGLAVAAGALSAGLIARRPSWRSWGTAATAAVMLLTWAWALAYMNIYRHEDARIAAAKFIQREVPLGAHVLVEPSHNIPPMGDYRRNPEFFTDYVGWGAETVRQDDYVLHTLDVYRLLYDGPLSVDQKRAYIRSRLSRVDFIVMDDTFEEFYQHLEGPEHAPVREYYRDLFAGKLGFERVAHYGVSPALFGLRIPDDRAEMTFSLFDHPDVFVFARRDGRAARAEP
jgi:hypothetical protein